MYGHAAKMEDRRKRLAMYRERRNQRQWDAHLMDASGFHRVGKPRVVDDSAKYGLQLHHVYFTI